MVEDPDEDLVRAIGRGDARAMRRLVERKLPRLLALARRMLADAGEAEDVAQEAFLRIWRNAATWKAGSARFDTWIHRVAMNLCYDRLRRRAVRTESEHAQEPPLALEAERDDPAEERRSRVEGALQAIAPRQREALVLVYYQELSNIEAAAAMGVSVDALESLLARGRRALHAILIRDRDND